MNVPRTPHRPGVVAARSIRRVAALVLALAVLGAAEPARVAARTDEEPAAKTAVPDDAADYKGWQIDDFELEDVPDGLHDPLMSGLALSGESSLFGRDLPRFYTETLAQDLERTRLFLARHGYPDASVEVRLSAAEDDQRAVDVTLAITAGPPVRVGSVAVSGAPSEIADDVRDAVTFEDGAVYRDAAVKESSRRMRDLLMENGHARARVVARTVSLDSTAVRVAFGITPGAVFHYGAVEVTGVSEGLRGLARKKVDIEPGDRYSPQTLDRAREQLQILRLFQRIEIDVADAGPDELRLTVRLTERDPRSIEAAIGYWTDLSYRVRAIWSHRNLLKRGRGVSVDGSYSKYLREAGLNTWWPAILTPHSRGTASVRLEQEREDAYHLDSRELELGLRFRPTILTTWWTRVTTSDIDVEIFSDDPDAYQGRGGLLTFLTLGWERNTCDNRISPQRGWVAWTEAQYAPPGLPSDHHYARLDAAVARFIPLGGLMVWANRLEAGWARPMHGSEDILPSKRFYAGGATSMRGFGRRELGPRDEEGDPLGGRIKALASTELRVPIFWRLRGAVFLDVGQVWSRPGDASAAELSYSAGPGLMIETPVGPLRADVGFRLSDVHPDLPRVVFHLGIGHPF